MAAAHIFCADIQLAAKPFANQLAGLPIWCHCPGPVGGWRQAIAWEARFFVCCYRSNTRGELYGCRRLRHSCYRCYTRRPACFCRALLRIKDVDGVTELAFACFLVGYIETISAARTLALKNNYEINPRQELLSMGFANLAAAFFSGYVISGGLSQSTVNDKSGAKTPMALIICSAALAMILVFFTGLLKTFLK